MAIGSSMGALFGCRGRNRMKGAVRSKPFENTRANVEKAAVQLKSSRLHPFLDPAECHQSCEREPHGFMFTNLLALSERHIQRAPERWLGETHPTADEVIELV